MSEKKGTVTLYVYGTVDVDQIGLPTALAGASVSVSGPDGDIVASGATDESGACTFVLQEGDYTATAKLEVADAPRKRGAQTGTKVYQGGTEEPFHVCQGEATDYPLQVELKDGTAPRAGTARPLLATEFSEDGATFGEYSSLPTPPRYGQPFYMRVSWKGHESLNTDLDADGAEVKLRRKTSDYDDYSIVPRASTANLALAVSTTSSKVLPRADTKIAAFPNAGGDYTFKAPDINRIEGSISTSLKRSASFETSDIALWSMIRRGSNAVSFDRYMDFMNWIFCGGSNISVPKGSDKDLSFVNDRRFLPFTDTDAYRNIKAATEAFLMANACVVVGNGDEIKYISDYVAIDPADLTDPVTLFNKYLVGTDKVLPYLAVIHAKLQDQGIKDKGIGDVDLSGDPNPINTCYGILRDKLRCPCLNELIWSYWNEEGMLVQTMNVITRRFQNMRGPLANDPLANFEIDPLRPLNNLIWGWVQDDQHRLSVVRRNYEYDHHYGLRLAGKAVDNMRTADSRSKFLEAFHTLLSTLAAFYKRDDDTTMVADGFPVLNALKEAHLILTQGAHNQFGDLPTTARIEMLMQQWILARPEFREFIPTRIMVAYPEPWMDRVEAMKKLQGWTDTSILHFRNLAIFGEEIILGVRWGNWNSIFEPVYAVNWARYWRPQVQGYLHAYRSVTGVDLSVDITNARIDATMPSVHLVKRLSDQRQRA
jgi:hypothetical protein